MSGYFVDQTANVWSREWSPKRKNLIQDASSNSATRVRLVLNPGQTAGLDSEEGRSLNFTCGEVRGAALVVDSGDREKACRASNS